jgi:hypothetical protein
VYSIPPELKKQLENTRIAKEQLEGKCHRLEADLKGSQDRCRLLEERNTK